MGKGRDETFPRFFVPVPLVLARLASRRSPGQRDRPGTEQDSCPDCPVALSPGPGWTPTNPRTTVDARFQHIINIQVLPEAHSRRTFFMNGLMSLFSTSWIPRQKILFTPKVKNRAVSTIGFNNKCQ